MNMVMQAIRVAQHVGSCHSKGMENAVKHQVAVVIVAAGRGERAGLADGPKQYRMMGGQSVLACTVSQFQRCAAIDCIQVVIHADDVDHYNTALTDWDKVLPPTIGGRTRQESVRAGLNALEAHTPESVLIHDAARPFVSQNLIERTVMALHTDPGVLPALPVVNTLKRSSKGDFVEGTVDRCQLHAAQTPQGFHFKPILAAHQQAEALGQTEMTDDSAIAEWAEIPVRLIEGDAKNKKLTTAQDLNEAQMAMETPIVDVRVGHGYDTHQLVPGDHVWLCGHRIEHNATLSGHSDADVGLHALTDALLSAIADGDIGSHFPPSDEQWKGARSDIFLKHAVSRVGQCGGTITHMDVTLICEQPKIGPHRDAMRAAIAAISGVVVERISVKATTNERMGFIGREEGIVALATATVVMRGTL